MFCSETIKKHQPLEVRYKKQVELCTAGSIYQLKSGRFTFDTWLATKA